ncbi:MAG TPA: copper chaperone PCu(A)C, partial [Burkholderiales bacterium]|nr:copper chaperone PCu(A)C [Burkholderiales bacterium]
MKKIIAALAVWMFSPFVFAQITVSEPWVRATVPAQKVTGGFMELKSDRPTALVGATSPMAGVVEIHEMRMDGDMARMR